MNDREKLIKLLGSTPDVVAWPHAKEKIADHLLANGVTFATDTNDGCKWISVEDRLPEEDLYCLVFRTFGYMRDGVVSLATYFPRYKGLSGDPMNTKQVWCKYSSEVGYYDISDSVTHWMPLPEPPKEDKHA